MNRLRIRWLRLYAAVSDLFCVVFCCFFSSLFLRVSLVPVPYRLSPSSCFLDIGSGIGQTVLHVRMAARVNSACGIEYVEGRHKTAEKVREESQSRGTCSFECAVVVR